MRRLSAASLLLWSAAVPGAAAAQGAAVIVRPAFADVGYLTASADIAALYPLTQAVEQHS